MRKSFTIIELIGVIIIIFVLSMVALPRVQKTLSNQSKSAAKANLETIVAEVTPACTNLYTVTLVSSTSIWATYRSVSRFVRIEALRLEFSTAEGQAVVWSGNYEIIEQ